MCHGAVSIDLPGTRTTSRHTRAPSSWLHPQAIQPRGCLFRNLMEAWVALDGSKIVQGGAEAGLGGISGAWRAHVYTSFCSCARPPLTALPDLASEYLSNLSHAALGLVSCVRMLGAFLQHRNTCPASASHRRHRVANSYSSL
jgi:hypothetical protein